jgi:hypothetical protein
MNAVTAFELAKGVLELLGIKEGQTIQLSSKIPPFSAAPTTWPAFTT